MNSLIDRQSLYNNAWNFNSSAKYSKKGVFGYLTSNPIMRYVALLFLSTQMNYSVLFITCAYAYTQIQVAVVVFFFLIIFNSNNPLEKKNN